MMPEYQIKILQRVQKIAAKLVVQDKFVEFQQSFKYLHWLLVKLCIQLKVLVVVFKCLVKKDHKCLKNLIVNFQNEKD